MAYMFVTATCSHVIILQHTYRTDVHVRTNEEIHELQAVEPTESMLYDDDT